MPSPDRPQQGRDRPEAEGARPDAGRAGTMDAPIEPPQYFDPSEPWDAQSAEALVRHYESGEGYVPRGPEDERLRLLRQRQLEMQAAQVRREEPGSDNVRLEARLAEIAERLQKSLAEINPDKAIGNLNRRLDAIETHFNEALGRVAQRSDMDGLKFIEAHVMELAAHVEQARGRLDRIDAIDEQMQALSRQLQEDGGHQRLEALEKLLENYVSEWRKGDERTTSSLRNLEDVVGRVSESIETIEAYRPAPDLSLSQLGATGLGEPSPERDPLSQVYADAAHALEPTPYRAALDAADYAPKSTQGVEASGLVPLRAGPDRQDDQESSKPTGDTLPSPSLLVSMMRNKLRLALGTGGSEPSGQQSVAAADAKPSAPAKRRSRPNLLLSAGMTLFAAIGYLLVDVFMSTSAAPRPPADAELSARAPETKAQITGGIARIEGISHAIAAAFRNEEPKRPPVEATASIQQETPPAHDDLGTSARASLPMTIGPASLRQAAMRGDAAAQTEVASRYAAGQGVARDLGQAVQWYGRAAAQGSAMAQYRLAALYERGMGTTQDAERARVWYARAAEQGNVKAMHNLAVLSVSGGRSDYAVAAKWFTLAADFGLADSQVNLAILYQNGLGVPKDLTRTYKWLALAGRSGDREAAARMAQIKSRLSSGDLEAADAMIAAWRARVPDAAVNESAIAATTLDLGR